MQQRRGGEQCVQLFGEWSVEAPQELRGLAGRTEAAQCLGRTFTHKGADLLDGETTSEGDHQRLDRVTEVLRGVVDREQTDSPGPAARNPEVASVRRVWAR